LQAAQGEFDEVEAISSLDIQIFMVWILLYVLIPNEQTSCKLEIVRVSTRIGLLKLRSQTQLSKSLFI
jgi:hypothetical protein